MNPEMDDTKLRRRKTAQLRLTKFELVHLRDLMSVLTPPAADTTISQHLASLEERSLVESVLWKKISQACQEMDIPMGDDAPDFIVAPASPPPIGVFRLAEEPAEESEDDE
jgi:hypothetical protein